MIACMDIMLQDNIKQEDVDKLNAWTKHYFINCRETMHYKNGKFQFKKYFIDDRPGYAQMKKLQERKKKSGNAVGFDFYFFIVF